MTFFLILSALLCVEAVQYNPSEKLELFVDSNTNNLVDSFGRERIFHGTNVIVKGYPYFPTTEGFDAQTSFAEEDMSLIESLGFNSIRLSVPWVAVEPQRGVYNETYLNIINDIINKAGSYGIYTLIDFHQDAWSELFCGNGVPDWAIPESSVGTFPIPVVLHTVPSDPATGYPTKAACDSINNNNWSLYYLSYATSSAIGAVYDNQNSLADAFASYWKKVATKFASSPYVIGYELMNEPFAGNIYKDPLLLIPGVADRKKLQPLFDLAANAIREVDKEKLVLFQGVTWEVVLPIGERYGFENAPGSSLYANKSVLSWHCSVKPNWTPDIKYFGWKKDEMKRMGVGGWVTEGGTGIFDLQDSTFLSWMNWDYKLFSDLTWDNSGLFFSKCLGTKDSLDDCLDKVQAKSFARTYAKAVGGLTNSFSFNQTTLIAHLDYEINPSITEPTVIFASKTWNYLGGFSVIIEPLEKATFTVEGSHVVVSHIDKAVGNLKITISPLQVVAFKQAEKY